MCWEGENAHESLRNALSELPADSLSLFVGPEGGFDEREVADARAAGVQTVSLGPQILRAETAAIAATALALLAP
jgi:16S rRNA (uracil1498-N3)-methyltransferase